MKKFLLVLFALISINAFAQSDSFKVKEGSFHHVQGCVTIPAHTDQNDLPMGVIKIVTDNINEQQRARLSFEGNLATGIEVEQHEGETWVYVTARAATFLRIKHPDFGVTEFNIPMEIEANKCYEMTLQYVNNQPEYGFLAISSEPTDADIYIDGKHYGKTNNVITDLAVGAHELKLEKEGYASLTKSFVTIKGETLKLNETLQAISNKKVHLIVKADQENATVYIDDEPLGTKEASKLFMLGTSHTWMIKCNMYHTESGAVTLNDRTVIDKKLRPNFGFLNISTTPEQDAKVFVDEEYVGLSPVKTDKLKSGTHIVRVMKDMYKMKEQSFTVNDGQTTNATLNMSANFVTLTLTVDADADIYVDEEYKGKGKWTGRLSEGSHIFEARKTNHKPSKKSMDLVLGENKTITLDAPTPINGEIEINTTPMGAMIYIDGKNYGETPNYISAILIGEHELKLVKQGCVEIKKTIVIKEGEALTINETLQTGKEISISTDKSGDKISVDGNYVGTSPLTTNLSYGSHEIKAEREGKTVSKNIEVSQVETHGRVSSIDKRLLNITENQQVITEAIEGSMKSYYFDKQYDKAIEKANQLMRMQDINGNQKKQANYILGKSYFDKKDYAEALKHFEIYSSIDNTETGAECAYLSAVCLYNTQRYDEAEEKVFFVLDKFGNYINWTARSFIILSDVYVAKDNIFQAKETLKSLIANYPDDKADYTEVIDMAQEKLNDIENTSNE